VRKCVILYTLPVGIKSFLQNDVVGGENEKKGVKRCSKDALSSRFFK